MIASRILTGKSIHSLGQLTCGRFPPFLPTISEVDLEYARWSEITALVHLVTPDERLAPG